MLDKIIKEIILVLHSNKNLSLLQKINSSNLEGKQFPHEGIL